MTDTNILKNLRGDRTQEEMAKELGITKSSWAMYERGERTPRDEVKVKIAGFFGKSIEELFFNIAPSHSPAEGQGPDGAERR